MPVELHDYQWLVGTEAAPLLAELADSAGDTLAFAARLRRQLSAERAHLVLAQLELRQRARRKFTAAARMFFTPRALEQATDEWVAAYKAARFAADAAIADFCCGIGGDLISLAKRAPALAMDRDPVMTLLADANCRAAGCSPVQTIAADVSEQQLDGVAAWHIDPDRRASGRRTTQVAQMEPPAEVIERLLARQSHAAIKLAPASEPPAAWENTAELEWISRAGECRQLVAWHGSLARHAGRRVATIVGDSGESLRTFVGSSGESPRAASSLGRFLHEPDAAVLAADLVGALACELGLQPIAAGAVYLTSESAALDPALASFEILAELPHDARKIKALLRERRIGRLELKQRGVQHDLRELHRRWQVPGDESATLLLTRRGKAHCAILARRV